MKTAEDTHQVALAEWLRRMPAKYMGFPRKSWNLLVDGYEIENCDLLPFARKRYLECSTVLTVLDLQHLHCDSEQF